MSGWFKGLPCTWGILGLKGFSVGLGLKGFCEYMAVLYRNACRVLWGSEGFRAEEFMPTQPELTKLGPKCLPMCHLRTYGP